MSRIQPAIIGETPFERLLGHDEDVMRQWTTLGDTLTDDGKLSTELKEQVRRTLAQQNGCDYCRGILDVERKDACLVNSCAAGSVHGC